ncbi:hypothetical protein INR49_020335 [Caranx melampygus]|nr:hypothetical protein INR49_020335 [Caranx melampygus]
MGGSMTSRRVRRRRLHLLQLRNLFFPPLKQTSVRFMSGPEVRGQIHAKLQQMNEGHVTVRLTSVSNNRH